MKIIWTDFASETLSEIYQFYKENASPIVAKKIKSEIFRSTRQKIRQKRKLELSFIL